MNHPRSSKSSGNSDSATLELLTPESLARTGAAIVAVDWNRLGFGPVDADATLQEQRMHTVETSDPVQIQHRITALLAARCAALVAPFPDISTHTICQAAIQHGWPEALTKKDNVVLEQIAEFVRRMLMGYKDVPYHNRKHAYHVVLSTSKMIDMMILSSTRTYGIRHDPLALLALTFAALIHDVEHQGIPNRQLALEDDRLAVLYNDQSMAENWSLYVAFSELLQDEFQEMRDCLFQQNEATTPPEEPVASSDYRRFRKLVVNLVLCTDLASPERTQIGKSKWKEAFGDPYETLERKLRSDVGEMPEGRQRRASITGSRILIAAGRRGSAVSAISTPNSHRHSAAEDDHDEDDSLSGTPDPSEDESDDARNHSLVTPKFLTDAATAADSVALNKLERRLSASSVQSSKYRQRLGILRTVDLSGETLETYDRRGSIATTKSNQSAAEQEASPGEYHRKLQADEPDELKATVVMETLMTAADVAHNLQGWDHMVKWSGRLYMELRRAHVAKRGFDPQEKWFENQIGFLESYLLPVARRLEDTGVFGEEMGQMFTATVEANRDRWLTQGYEETQKIIAAGNKKYPSRESS
jgi:3'5'-cyclic nucleotide phosphodiesterase